LCGSIPMITPIGLLLIHPTDVEQGGHRYFEQDNPFPASPRAVPDETACHERATPKPRWAAAYVSVSPDT
jgi:hypothetical protein